MNNPAGDNNTLQSLTVSGIPVNETLTDGHGNSFTSAIGSTSVDVTGWSLSSLSIPFTVHDANYVLTATATVVDASGNTSTGSATESVVITPSRPFVYWSNAGSPTGTGGSMTEQRGRSFPLALPPPHSVMATATTTRCGKPSAGFRSAQR